MTCICSGFGQIHPVKPSGKIDYSQTVYCRCQNERAGDIASPPIFSPDTDNDIYTEVMPDFYRADRNSRERREFLLKQEPIQETLQVKPSPVTASNGGLLPIKSELSYLRNKLNAHLDRPKPKTSVYVLPAEIDGEVLCPAENTNAYPNW